MTWELTGKTKEEKQKRIRQSRKLDTEDVRKKTNTAEEEDERGKNTDEEDETEPESTINKN